MPSWVGGKGKGLNTSGLTHTSHAPIPYSELVILLVQAAETFPLGPEQAHEALTAMDDAGG